MQKTREEEMSETHAFLEDLAEVELMNYLEETKRQITANNHKTDAIEETIRKVTETLFDELHRNQEQVSKDSQIAYMIYLIQEERRQQG